MKSSSLSKAHHFTQPPIEKRGGRGRFVRRAGKGFGQKEVSKPETRSQKSPQVHEDGDVQQFATRSQQQQPQQTQIPRPGQVMEVPEVVNQRLLNRMLTFSLVPVFLGFLSLPLLAYVQVGLKIDLPTGTAFAVSGLCFGAGLLGITYGILSASWDENQEGSKLGLDEFKSNASPFIDRIKNGPRR